MKKITISHYSLNCFFLRQYQDFLEDLEEDEALRKNINIFRGKQQDIYTAVISASLCYMIYVPIDVRLSSVFIFSGVYDPGYFRTMVSMNRCTDILVIGSDA